MKTLLVLFLFAGTAQAESIAFHCDGKTQDGRAVTLEIPSTGGFTKHVSKKDDSRVSFPIFDLAPAVLSLGETKYSFNLDNTISRTQKLFVPENSELQIFRADTPPGIIYTQSWSKVPVRRQSFYIETLDGRLAKGYFKFRVRENGKKNEYKIDLTCDLTR